MRMLIAAVLLLLTAACATGRAETWQQRVYGLQADYDAVLAAAVAYESLPRCAAGQSLPEVQCSDPEVVGHLRTADDAAAAALQAAQQTVRAPGAEESAVLLAVTAAANAVGALQGILTGHGVLAP